MNGANKLYEITIMDKKGRKPEFEVGLIKTIRSLIGPSKKYQYITFVSSSASNVI
jgi:hypothetical protein